MTKKKNDKTLIEILRQTPDELEAPWEVWTTMGDQSKKIMFAGKQISLGGDYKSLDEARATIDWYVRQLGGTAKWGEE